jgi:exonuclease SbcC
LPPADDILRGLEQLKQSLENQIQQATALSGQANQQLQAHVALRPEGLEADASTLQIQLQQLAQQLRENTTHQGEIRQQQAGQRQPSASADVDAAN